MPASGSQPVSGGYRQQQAAETVPGPSGDDVPAPPTTEPTSDSTVPDDSSPPTVPAPGFLPGFDGATFDSRIADPLLRSGALSVSIAVAKDGRLIHAEAYGIADPATGEPATATSRYRIASNSKMFTATTALELVDEGLLSLDTPGVLEPLAAQFGIQLGDPRMHDVTLRQLLQHLSGFADFTAEFFREGAVGCEDAAIAALGGRLSGSPGGSFNYSNMNFCIIGLLIEVATGDGYEQAVGDRLLTPLGIRNMRVTGNGDRREGEVVHLGSEERNFMEVLGGAGSWVATASDLVTLVDSLDTSRPGWHPISVELAAEMQGGGDHAQPARSHGFGLGLRIWPDGTWGHTGTIQSVRSMVIHQPDGYTWAVLVSGNVPSDSDDLRNSVRRAFDALGVPPGWLGSPVAFPVPDALSVDGHPR